MTDLEAADLVEMVLADPPRIHALAPSGVWSTDADCYRLLADYAVPGAHTLETGCGVSTIVLAARGAHHTCVAFRQDEADGIAGWARDHDVELPNLRFLVGDSTTILPTLERNPLDLVFIDGNHQFPTPVIDWFYAVRRLRKGGIVVLDDVQLAGPRLVADYMAGSSLVRTIQRTSKWAAFQLHADAAEAGKSGRAHGGPLIRGGLLERLGRRGDRALLGLSRFARGRARG